MSDLCKAHLTSAPRMAQAFEANRPSSDAANQAKLQVIIPNPQLWWPNGYGDAAALPGGGRTVIKMTNYWTSAHYQLGLRTIELRQQPDEWGRSFTFVVNGLPIFVKGSNWIPANSFPTRISDAYLEGLIRSAARDQPKHAARLGRRIL